MANRKATFAKRQRETDLKDRAKQKEDRRSQKRGEVRDVKGPQIAWDEAVHAVTSDELPPLESANQGDEGDAEGDGDDAPGRANAAPAGAASGAPAPAATAPAPEPAAAPRPSTAPAKSGPVSTKPTTSPGPASPRRAG